MKPKHFSSTLDFEIYVLNLAIRDREEFLCSITPRHNRTPNDTLRKTMDETSSEIEIMRKRRKRLEARRTK